MYTNEPQKRHFQMQTQCAQVTKTSTKIKTTTTMNGVENLSKNNGTIIIQSVSLFIRLETITQLSIALLSHFMSGYHRLYIAVLKKIDKKQSKRENELKLCIKHSELIRVQGIFQWTKKKVRKKSIVSGGKLHVSIKDASQTNTLRKKGEFQFDQC